MNWLFPLSKGSGPPPLNSLQQQRQRQIESLKVAHPSLAEIQKDVEYRIPFTVNNSTISVNMPINYHVMSATLKLNLKYFDNILRLKQTEWNKSVTPLFSNSMYKPGMTPYPTQAFHYGPRHMSPSLTQSTGPAPSPTPMTHPVTESAQGPPRVPAPYGLISDLPLPVPTGDSQAGLNGHLYKMPEIPESFPELSEMNLIQLSNLSENEDVLLELFVGLPQLKQVSSDKEELITNIVEMAKKNIQAEPQLEGKRQEMLYKVEEMAENFLEGRTDIDEFLSSFMEKRTLCHSRRAKEEKLQQSINTLGQFPASH
uniref:VPS37A subunit of ESCRT-I n=1 Tax=Tetraodon nigroviridis TaxID=99883 RepID=H3BXB1_TETNG